MSRQMTTKKGRKCRVKTPLRMWLDKAVMGGLRAIQNDHPDLSISDHNALIMMRKRLAGSIFDGLRQKLEAHGIKFPEEM